MASECLAAIHLCRIRATRLNADGTPKAGPNNYYVTDKPMVLNVTPVIEAGTDRTLVGGCDCILATYRGFDKLKRFDLELDLGVMEPALFELLLGSTAITSGSDVIGQWWTLNAFDCSTDAQPPVAVEGWQTAWNESGPDATFPYVHWIWPMAFFQIAQHSLQNDFNQPRVTGFTRGNNGWGTGPYGDSGSVEPLGGFFYATTIPTAACAYGTQAVT